MIFLFLPIAVMILFSFNDPAGRQNITWQGFTLENYLTVWSRPDITGPLVLSLDDRDHLDDRGHHPRAR